MNLDGGSWRNILKRCCCPDVTFIRQIKLSPDFDTTELALAEVNSRHAFESEDKQPSIRWTSDRKSTCIKLGAHIFIGY